MDKNYIIHEINNHLFTVKEYFLLVSIKLNNKDSELEYTINSRIAIAYNNMKTSFELIKLLYPENKRGDVINLELELFSRSVDINSYVLRMIAII